MQHKEVHVFDSTVAKSGLGAANHTSQKMATSERERNQREEQIYKRENAKRLKREERQRKKQLLNSIPDETQVGAVADFMYQQGIVNILEKLDYDLVGLDPVKARVREIAALLIIAKMRSKIGLETPLPSLHMSFTGSPGTGKTTVALRMGQILQRMGYCRKGHVVVATRDDLVGQYQGHTVPKTKEVIKRATGGVLFIDEAHNLLNAESDSDYGQESINILLDVMENKKDDLVVVLAGYEDKMDGFYSLVPGMKSRIGNIIDFPDYGANDMVEIAKVMCREFEYDMEDAAIEKLRDYFRIRQTMPFFANARTVRNTIDQARMRQAIRLLEEKSLASSDGVVSEDELSLITAADIPGEADLESDSGASVTRKEAEQAAGRLSFNPGLAGGILSFEECVADGILSFEECLAERVAMMAERVAMMEA